MCSCFMQYNDNDSLVIKPTTEHYTLTHIFSFFSPFSFLLSTNQRYNRYKYVRGISVGSYKLQLSLPPLFDICVINVFADRGFSWYTHRHRGSRYRTTTSSFRRFVYDNCLESAMTAARYFLRRLSSGYYRWLPEFIPNVFIHDIHSFLFFTVYQPFFLILKILISLQYCLFLITIFNSIFLD